MGNTKTRNQRSLLANHVHLENHHHQDNKPSWNELLGGDMHHFISRIIDKMDDPDTLRRAQNIQERVTP